MKEILKKGLAALASLAVLGACSGGAAAQTVFQTSGSQGGAGLFPKSASAPALPVPAVRVQLLSAQTAAVPGKPLQLSVRLAHEPGWHTYWKNPGDAGAATEFEWTLPKGWAASDPLWPAPRARRVQGIANYAIEGDAQFPVTVSVPAAAVGNAKISVKVSWIACKEQCVPGEASAELDIPVSRDAAPAADEPRIAAAIEAAPKPAPEGFARASADGRNLIIAVKGEKQQIDFYPAQPGLADLSAGTALLSDAGESALVLRLSEAAAGNPPSEISGVLVTGGGKALDVRLPLKKTEAGSPFAGAKLSAAAGGSESPAPGGEASRLTLLSAALFAALGGLILNLMPCVFPILSLKMLGLVKASKEKSLLPHGIAFTAGVLLSMAALSGTLIALKALGSEIGWGFQLQSPLVVLLLSILFWAIALNLAGVYEFTFGSRAAGSLSMRSPTRGTAGSFATGILAVIVASPCTAPFMGAAIGFALAQPAAVSVAVFLSLGAGMALPWLLLTVFPGWTRKLPKPGPWMATLRRVMAIPVAGALAWLLWVLARQVSGAGFAVALAILALAGASLFLYGRGQTGMKNGAYFAAYPLAVATALTVFMGTGRFTQAAADVPAGWEAWSPEAVASATASGQPAFIDFTAAWCVTCQVNKKAVLDTEAAKEAFAANGYRLFLADWTSRDEKISRELERWRHNGVPLYLVVSPSGETQVLPELLTREALIEALGKGRN